MEGKIGRPMHLTKGWHVPTSAKKNGVCPSCGSSDAIKKKGTLKIISGKSKKFLVLGCTRFPECKFTKNIKNKYEYKKRRNTRGLDSTS